MHIYIQYICVWNALHVYNIYLWVEVIPTCFPFLNMSYDVMIWCVQSHPFAKALEFRLYCIKPSVPSNPLIAWSNIVWWTRCEHGEFQWAVLARKYLMGWDWSRSTWLIIPVTKRPPWRPIISSVMTLISYDPWGKSLLNFEVRLGGFALRPPHYATKTRCTWYVIRTNVEHI